MGTLGDLPSRAVEIVGIGDVDGEVGLLVPRILEVVGFVALGEDDECNRTDAFAGDDAVFVDRGDLLRTVGYIFYPFGLVCGRELELRVEVECRVLSENDRCRALNGRSSVLDFDLFECHRNILGDSQFDDAETPSTMTEIVVVPTVSAVTSPSALTVATVLSDES